MTRSSDVHISRCSAKLSCYHVTSSDGFTFKHTKMVL